TFLVPAGLRDHANVFDRAVRHQQAMLVSKVAGATSYLGDLLLQHRYIFGMIARADIRKRYACSGLKLVNTIDFLGTYRVVSCGIEQETASQTETLSFREECLAALERSLGLQPVDCDARDVGRMRDETLVIRRWCRRSPLIDAKRADDSSLFRADRR